MVYVIGYHNIKWFIPWHKTLVIVPGSPFQMKHTEFHSTLTTGYASGVNIYRVSFFWPFNHTHNSVRLTKLQLAIWLLTVRLNIYIPYISTHVRLHTDTRTAWKTTSPVIINYISFCTCSNRRCLSLWQPAIDKVSLKRYIIDKIWDLQMQNINDTFNNAKSYPMKHLYSYLLIYTDDPV